MLAGSKYEAPGLTCGAAEEDEDEAAAPSPAPVASCVCWLTTADQSPRSMAFINFRLNQDEDRYGQVAMWMSAMSQLNEVLTANEAAGSACTFRFMIRTKLPCCQRQL